jgi:ribosomal-protein-alanine N-acetyltransferase
VTTIPEALLRPVDTATCNKVVVRPASEEDLPAVEKLDEDVFGDVALSLMVLKFLYLPFRKTWHVVECDGVLAGYALVCPDSDNSEAWLMGLAVSGDHQGRGLGRQLMKQAMVSMMKAGANDAYITVRPDNEAAYHLYQQFGFTQKGEEKPNFWHNGEPRKVLHRSLVTHPYIEG